MAVSIIRPLPPKTCNNAAEKQRASDLNPEALVNFRDPIPDCQFQISDRTLASY
jgi:hypothetical protein